MLLLGPATGFCTPFVAAGVVTAHDDGCGRECTLVGSGNNRVLMTWFSVRETDVKVNDVPNIDLVPLWLVGIRVLSRIFQNVVRSTCLDKFGEFS